MHTSIGKLVEAIANGAYSAPSQQYERQLREQVLAVITGAPHYVADLKVLKLIGDTKVQDGFTAMVRAGIRQLPFDPILVEFRDPTTNGVSFVRLQSKPMAPPSFDVKNSRAHGDLYCYPVGFDADPRTESGRGFIVATVAETDPVIVDFCDDPAKNRPYTVYMGHGPDHQESTNKRLSLDVAEAMSIAMLMLNTRGIEKVPVDTTGLNKARDKAAAVGKERKPRISPYTVIKIGHIYDRHGNAHSVDGSGRHMPVHWRAGHVRNVRYGPLSEPGKHRPVFIPACLVNYEGGDAPLPKREVTV